MHFEIFSLRLVFYWTNGGGVTGGTVGSLVFLVKHLFKDILVGLSVMGMGMATNGWATALLIFGTMLSRQVD